MHWPDGGVFGQRQYRRFRVPALAAACATCDEYHRHDLLLVSGEPLPVGPGFEKADATISTSRQTEIIFVRHAPALTGDAVIGQRDVDIVVPDDVKLDRLRALIGPISYIVSSPARRCLATARALFPSFEPHADARLWEQSFGAWEGRTYSDLPDLGSLSGGELANYRPPGGESFADVCHRVQPAVLDLARVPDRIAVLAHAGSIRAALTVVLGDAFHLALAFEIAPLSATMLRRSGENDFAIGYVNRTF